MKTIDIKNATPLEQQGVLQYAIAPRPICFASTVDAQGNVNLSPFSFFNLFGVNPAICVFSPSRSARTNKIKHTLENLREVPEVVINIVNYAMVQQTSLASTEYPKGINEFVKAGFTEVASSLVRPPRVLEAPVQLECKVKEIIELAETPGSGNLVVAEILLAHVSEEILDANGRIDQAKIDLVARLGGNWYARITKESLFEVAKPLSTLGIGVDALPEQIRLSRVLTGNHLGQLGNIEKLPSTNELVDEAIAKEISNIRTHWADNKDEQIKQLHLLAANYLDKNEVTKAWQILL